MVLKPKKVEKSIKHSMNNIILPRWRHRTAAQHMSVRTVRAPSVWGAALLHPSILMTTLFLVYVTAVKF